MPKKISHYRVFLATPGGLEAEREAFRHLLQEYNEIEGKLRDMQFDPVGWEDVPGGSGRPQSLINEELIECDYFILAPWDRWGSSPSAPGEPGFSSGCEEEFRLAVECCENSLRHMRDVVILFKAVDPRHLADPGPQLQKVLDFKRETELRKRHFFKTFDGIPSFRQIVRGLLASWPLKHKRGIDSMAGLKVMPSVARRNVPPAGDPEIESAERLANKGRLVEAEILFARAAVSGKNKLDALNRYGQFLLRRGRLRLAEEMYLRLIEFAEPGLQEWIALSYGNLGLIYRTLGKLPQAEKMLKDALEINRELRLRVGMASNYSNLGAVYGIRGDLVEAETMHRRALEIDKELGRTEGMAIHYGNLGLIMRVKGDLPQAEAMHSKALEIHGNLGRREGMAIQFAGLGLVCENRGDFEHAEVMYRKALQINEELGRLKGVAIQYGNLGRIYRVRNDLDRAEEMHRRALEINEQLERRRGLAIQYGDLGEISRLRGDLNTAREYWTKSQNIFREMSAAHMVARTQEWLDRLKFEELGIKP